MLTFLIHAHAAQRDAPFFGTTNGSIDQFGARAYMRVSMAGQTRASRRLTRRARLDGWPDARVRFVVKPNTRASPAVSDIYIYHVRTCGSQDTSVTCQSLESATAPTLYPAVTVSHHSG